MTRLAAIDIGTNSTKMTIADADEAHQLQVVSELSDVTRLGEGVDASKRLSEEAMTRTLAAIKRFAEEAHAQGAVQVLGAGTSALRDAENGSEFIDKIQQETGVAVEIITGDREAQLAYEAVHSDSDLGLPDGFPVLTFDIGGGSTELTLGGAQGVERHVSLDIGAVRVTERYLHADPPTPDELAEADAFVRATLETFLVPQSRSILVGIGGTAVNLAAVTVHGSSSEPESIHAVMLSDRDVQAALARFQQLPLAARRAIPGLEPKRADVIIGGALILRALLSHFDSDRFLVSIRGLRYGLLAEQARR